MTLCHSVHPPPFLLWGRGGGLILPSNFKKGVLTETQFLERVAGKDGVVFFRGGCNFLTKKHLECLKTKKVYKQECFALSSLRIETGKF